MNTKKHEMKNRAFDSEKEGGCLFSLFYYDTLKHDETVIRPTILYTLMTLCMPFWQVLLFLHMIKETKKKGEGFNKQD